MGKIPMNVSVRRSGVTARKAEPVEAEGKKPKVEEFNLWKCKSCGITDLSFDAMKDHLFGVHGVDPEKTSCERKMLMHMDGRDFYASSYEVKIAGVVLVNDQKRARRSEGRMWRD